jgi:hypothetical protein
VPHPWVLRVRFFARTSVPAKLVPEAAPPLRNERIKNTPAALIIEKITTRPSSGTQKDAEGAQVSVFEIWVLSCRFLSCALWRSLAACLSRAPELS